jgi:hypothetical protein
MVVVKASALNVIVCACYGSSSFNRCRDDSSELAEGDHRIIDDVRRNTDDD